MNKTTKITLEELIRRKEQMLESKKKPKTETLYIKSLDGTITIESPTAAMAREAQDMENGDAYMVYSCVTEPCLKSKELRDAFGCVEPMEQFKNQPIYKQHIVIILDSYVLPYAYCGIL